MATLVTRVLGTPTAPPITPSAAKEGVGVRLGIASSPLNARVGQVSDIHIYLVFISITCKP